ncbi:MAG TPA: pyridoxamine 5'-phosphate oxidase family protein [Solirubrobacteraceae bacterium]|nr:pyridoxamine 5'-phosphate oxidase family protein [Solirubrobacteraceae bacterium]
MALVWDDELDALFAADLTVALGYRTPAGGVVVQAVAPIGLHDRERGTLGFTTSLGFSKKLERLAADPRVAMAFHAREHGRASSTRYVLAQGTARVIEQPSEQERALVRANATSYLGAPKQGPFWDYWMREYYVSRVPVEVTATRICAWPTLDAAGAPEVVIGEPPASEPAPPQRPPRNGTGPRVDVERAAGRLRATAHTLLGYAGSDGAPVVVPVALVTEDATAGFVLSTASPLPTGGRRAGLLGHSYGAYLIGLNTRQHTGWLEVGDNGVVYAPHTETGYRTPANKTLQMLISGALAKQGVRAARTPDR